MSGLPAPPPSADLESANPTDETIPNQYQNEVLTQLNNPNDTPTPNIVSDDNDQDDQEEEVLNQ